MASKGDMPDIAGNIMSFSAGHFPSIPLIGQFWDKTHLVSDFSEIFEREPEDDDGCGDKRDDGLFVASRVDAKKRGHDTGFQRQNCFMEKNPQGEQGQN